MVQSHVLQCSSFTGPIVLFEGSPSMLANIRAVAELKFFSATTSQPIPSIVYRPLTENLTLPGIRPASKAKLVVPGSVSLGLVCRCA